MKKLLIYLLLIVIFEGFISATPCLSYSQKKLYYNPAGIEKTVATQAADINTEIHPLNVFSFRIN